MSRKAADKPRVVNSTWFAKKRLHPVAQKFKLLENTQPKKVHNVLGKESMNGRIASNTSVSGAFDEKGHRFSVTDDVTSPFCFAGGEFGMLKAVRDQRCFRGFTVVIFRFGVQVGWHAHWTYANEKIYNKNEGLGRRSRRKELTGGQVTVRYDTFPDWRCQHSN